MGYRLPFAGAPAAVRTRVLELPLQMERSVSDKRPLRFIGEFILWASAVRRADGTFDTAIRWVDRDWTGEDGAPSGVRSWGGAYAIKEDAEDIACDLLEDLANSTLISVLKLRPRSAAE